MAVGNNIYGILSTNAGVAAICGTRIYPGTIPQDVVTLPVVVYNVITGAPDNVLDAPAVADHELVQIDAWALTYDAASSLREAIRAAFEDQSVLITRNIGAKVAHFYPDAYEADTKRFSRSIGLSVWTGR